MSSNTDIKQITESNREAWDVSASSHAASDAWQSLVAGFADPAFSTFDRTIANHLTKLPISGKTVVQVGCNNGREVLSAMSLGATHGLGIDQSQKFLDQAEALNRIAHKNCQFLCTDIYDLPADTPRDFDVALITIGVLNWMPDLARFFAAVAGLLKDAGTLVIYETHPFLEMFDPQAVDPYKPDISYFTDRPYVSQEAIVYDGSDAGKGATSYWFNHSFSTIVNACVSAGLQIERLDEYPHSNREVDYDLYENQEAQLPMCYLLQARKAG